MEKLKKMKTIEINGQTCEIHDNLVGFKLFQKPSSNVAYFGTYPEDKDNCGQLFMQFMTGKGYVYSNVPKEVLDLAESAPSIGKYYYAFIKGKYPEMAVDDHCITAQKDARFVEEEDDEDWDPDEDFAFGDI